jgi:hypothetical protein
MDALYSLFADHGPAALAWTLSALAGVALTYLVVRIRWEYVRGVVTRAIAEIQDAVLEVAQVFADEIKRASEDGKLTAEEKAVAKQMAIDTAKSNLGSKGLKRLSRVLGLGDVTDWIANKVEAAVATKPPKATALPPAA